LRPDTALATFSSLHHVFFAASRREVERIDRDENDNNRDEAEAENVTHVVPGHALPRFIGGQNRGWLV
jgi:hypothetical protein